MRRLGKAENRAGSGVQGQGCELNMGFNVSLVPAEESNISYPYGVTSHRDNNVRPPPLCTEIMR